jgi:transcriptional regulator with XRE-family HTH domain
MRLMSASVIDPESLAERLSRFLRREFGQLRCANRKIADRFGCDDRAAQNYLYGKNPPNAAALMRMMAASEALEEEILTMVREHRRSLRE